MTKEQILAQPTYQEAIKEFYSKSMDFDLAAKEYKENTNPQKEQELMLASKSAWALYCYQMSYLFYLAENVKDNDVNVAIEVKKYLKHIVFDNLQKKYEYIMFITNPRHNNIII